MNIQIVGPMGLTVLSCLVSACGDGGHNAIVPSANVSMFMQSTAPIDNVEQLTLQIEPATMHVACTGGVACPYYAFIADNESNNRSHPSSSTDLCRDVVKGYVNGLPIYERQCDALVEDITIIKTSITKQPLGPTPIVRDVNVPEEFLRTFSHIELRTRSTANVRDSYVHLDDGRECEINIVFPVDATFPLQNFAISNRDDLNITLMLDFSGTVIDPTRCEAPQDVYIRPVRADIKRM